jgi:hypothetical protein
MEMKAIRLQSIFLFAVMLIGAAVVRADVYTPPVFDWGSVPGSASLNSSVTIGAQFTTKYSDDGSLNYGSPDQMKLYRIIMYVTKPDGNTDIVADWIPGWPVGNAYSENSVSSFASFTVTQIGTYTVNFTAMDGRPWYTAGGTYTFSVTSPTPTITSSLATLNLARDQSYTYTITATNSPTSFSASGLPPGFTLNPSTGAISGTASTAGNYTSTIGATNGYGSTSNTLVWSVVAPSISNSPTVSPNSIISGGSVTLTPNGSANFGVAWIERVIFTPSGAGFSLGNQNFPNHNASASYIPIAGPGTYTFLTRVVDNYSHFTDATTTFTVLPPPPAITSASTLGILFGQTATYQTTASNAPTSFGFAWTVAASGPASFVGGLLTVTPSAAGVFGFTVSATNTGGTGSLTVTFTVSKTTPTITFASQTFPTTVTLSSTQLNATTGNPYSGSVAAPSGSISYSIVSASGGNASPTSGSISAGSILYPGTYTVRATYPGDSNYNATTKDVTFTVSNSAPHVSNLSATPNTVLFGQSSTIASTITDTDSNLYAHGLLLQSADGSTWFRPLGVDYARTGWNVFASDSSNFWSSASFTDDIPTGTSSSSKSAVFTAGSVRSFVFHANGHDGTLWTDNAPTYVLTVNKSTPVLGSFPSRSYSSGLPTYTWAAADANAVFANAYSASVAAPSGTITYSIVGPGTTVTAGTQFGPGSYTIRASYPGDANYNATTADMTLTFTQLPPSITSSLNVSGNLGVPFSYQIIASNNPTSFTATGTLPLGLNFTSATGTISGTPGSPGVFPITISASNSAGSSTKTLTITITGVAVTSSGTIVFPDAVQGSTSQRTASITNAGNTTLSVSFLTAYGDQSAGEFIAPTTPLSIPAGSTTDITLSFSPATTGAKTGAFILFDSDSTATPVKYVLQGNSTTSTPPQVPTASISADSASIRMGQSTTIRATYAAGAYDALSGTSIDAPAGTVLAGADGMAQSFRTYNFTPSATGTYTFFARAFTPNFGWASYASTTVTVLSAQYTLTVSVSGPGSANPSGTTTYNLNDVATVTATWPNTVIFTGWQGDASGTAATINLAMTANRNVTAVFNGKASQTITFVDPGSQVIGQQFPLVVSASSGLPVALTITSGNAIITGDAASGFRMTITTAGAVVVTASQAGNAAYLPAPDVSRSINGVTAALKVRQDSDRVKILRGDKNDNPTVIIGRP